MAHENNPDYMQLPLFRIVVDGMYYCGELVSNTYTFNDPFSSNSFHTAPGGKTTLEFSENHEKAKLIEGRNNLASHVKRVIEFVTCASDMPKEIKIERSPFPIPLTMNIDYFLDIESENTKLKAKIAELTNGKIDGLEIVMTKQIKKMIDKELKKRFEELKPELATRYEELLNMRNMEADQFNDGFNDARAGKLETDQPHYDLDTDNWRLGYAWGMFEPMKEKLARERQVSDAEIEELGAQEAERKEFCPNCEAETPCTHEAELFVCDICGEDFAKYIVSRNCNVSDVSITQDVLTDVKTPRSIENNNPDYYKDDVGKWIPIASGRLPEKFQECIVLDKNNRVHNWIHDDVLLPIFAQYTHWMPLSEPAEEEER